MVICVFPAWAAWVDCLWGTVIWCIIKPQHFSRGYNLVLLLTVTCVFLNELYLTQDFVVKSQPRIWNARKDMMPVNGVHNTNF